MKILIIDDSPKKRERLREVIEYIVPIEAVTIHESDNVREALNRMASTVYDVAILDLMIPLRKGEESRSDGGIHALRAIRRAKTLHIPTHVIGLSAYPELIEKHSSEFVQDLWFLVRYEDDNDEWVEGIARRLLHVMHGEDVKNQYDYDLAIVTALYPVELENVLKLPVDWTPLAIEGDDTPYHQGVFSKGDRQSRVIAAACNEMGMASASAVAMKMIAQFRPRYLAMTGIAAGVKGEFGDVLVADASWDYGSGKTRHTKRNGLVFLPAPSSIPIDPHLKSLALLATISDKIPSRIASAWLGAPQPALPTIRVGPVASGAAVVENKPLINEIVGRDRKLIGVEMETYGVYMAARMAREPRPLVLSAKAICDFGSPSKDDKYQQYAGFTSSRFLYEFWQEYLADSG